jgi:uncharacterized membrane protein
LIYNYGKTTQTKKLLLYIIGRILVFLAQKYCFMSKKHISHARHLAKSISWRVVGTLDTMLIASIISGNPVTGIKIGGVEVFTKIILYYLHERFWYKFIKFGIEEKKE